MRSKASFEEDPTSETVFLGGRSKPLLVVIRSLYGVSTFVPCS